MLPYRPNIQKRSNPFSYAGVSYSFHIDGMIFGPSRQSVIELWEATEALRKTWDGSRLMEFAHLRHQEGKILLLVADKLDESGLTKGSHSIKTLYIDENVRSASVVQVVLEPGETEIVLAHELTHAMTNYAIDVTSTSKIESAIDMYLLELDQLKQNSLLTAKEALLRERFCMPEGVRNDSVNAISCDRDFYREICASTTDIAMEDAAFAERYFPQTLAKVRQSALMHPVNLMKLARSHSFPSDLEMALESLALTPSEYQRTLSGRVVHHGTGRSSMRDIFMGPNNVGNGPGGQGLYLVENNMDVANIFSTSKSASQGIIFEGTFPKDLGKYKIGYLQIDNSFSHTNKAKLIARLRDGFLPADWSENSMLREALLRRFDMLEVHYPGLYQYNGRRYRVIVVNENACRDLVSWRCVYESRSFSLEPKPYKKIADIYYYLTCGRNQYIFTHPETKLPLSNDALNALFPKPLTQSPMPISNAVHQPGSARMQSVFYEAFLSELDEALELLTVPESQWQGTINGRKIHHGAAQSSLKSLLEGPKNVGRGVGGQGLYVVENSLNVASYYAMGKAIGPENRGIVFEGVINLNPKRITVGAFEVDPSLLHVDRVKLIEKIKKGFLPWNWAEDKSLREAVFRKFDVLEVRYPGMYECNGKPYRVFVFHESVGTEAIVWKSIYEANGYTIKPMPYRKLADISRPIVRGTSASRYVLRYPKANQRFSKFAQAILAENAVTESATAKLPQMVQRSLVCPGNSRPSQPYRAMAPSRTTSLRVGQLGTMGKKLAQTLFKVTFTKVLPALDLYFEVQTHGFEDGLGIWTVRMVSYLNPWAVITAPLTMLGELANAPDISVEMYQTPEAIAKVISEEPKNYMLELAIDELCEREGRLIGSILFLETLQKAVRFFRLETFASENVWFGIKPVCHHPYEVINAEVNNLREQINLRNEVVKRLKQYIQGNHEEDVIIGRYIKNLEHECRYLEKIIQIDEQILHLPAEFLEEVGLTLRWSTVTEAIEELEQLKLASWNKYLILAEEDFAEFQSAAFWVAWNSISINCEQITTSDVAVQDQNGSHNTVSRSVARSYVDPKKVERYEYKKELELVDALHHDIAVRGNGFMQDLANSGDLLSRTFFIPKPFGRMLAWFFHVGAETLNAVFGLAGPRILSVDMDGSSVLIALKMRQEGGNSAHVPGAAFTASGLGVAFDGSSRLNLSFRMGENGLFGLGAPVLTIGTTLITVLAVMAIKILQKYISAYQKYGILPWNRKAVKRFFKGLQKNIDTMCADYNKFQEAMLKLYGATDLEPEARHQMMQWIDEAWQVGQVALKSAKKIKKSKSKKVKRSTYETARRAGGHMVRLIEGDNIVLKDSDSLPTDEEMRIYKACHDQWKEMLKGQGGYLGDYYYKPYCYAIGAMINHYIYLAMMAYKDNDPDGVISAWNNVLTLIRDYHLFCSETQLRHVTLIIIFLADVYQKKYGSLDDLYNEIKELIDLLKQNQPAAAELLQDWLAFKQILNDGKTNLAEIEDEIEKMSPRKRSLYKTILAIERALESDDPVSELIEISNQLIVNTDLDVWLRLQLFQVLAANLLPENFITHADYQVLVSNAKVLVDEAKNDVDATDKKKQDADLFLASLYGRILDLAMYEEAQTYLRELLENTTDSNQVRAIATDLAQNHLNAYEIWQALEVLEGQGTSHVSVNAVRRQAYNMGTEGVYSWVYLIMQGVDARLGTRLTSHSSILDIIRLGVLDYISWGHQSNGELAISHIPVISNLIRRYGPDIGIWTDYALEWLTLGWRGPGSYLAPQSLTQWKSVRDLLLLRFIRDSATFSEVLKFGIGTASSATSFLVTASRIPFLLWDGQQIWRHGRRRLPISRTEIGLREVVHRVSQAQSICFIGVLAKAAANSALGLVTGWNALVATQSEIFLNQAVGGISSLLASSPILGQVIVFVPLIAGMANRSYFNTRLTGGDNAICLYIDGLMLFASPVLSMLSWLISKTTGAEDYLNRYFMLKKIEAHIDDLNKLLQKLQGLPKNTVIADSLLEKERFFDAHAMVEMPKVPYMTLKGSAEKLHFIILQMTYYHCMLSYDSLREGKRKLSNEIIQEMQVQGWQLLEELLLQDVLSKFESATIKLFVNASFNVDLVQLDHSASFARICSYQVKLLAQEQSNQVAMDTLRQVAQDTVYTVEKLNTPQAAAVDTQMSLFLLECYCMAFQFGIKADELLQSIAQKAGLAPVSIIESVYKKATKPLVSQSADVFRVYEKAIKDNMPKQKDTGRLFQFFKTATTRVTSAMGSSDSLNQNLIDETLRDMSRANAGI